MIAHSSIRVHCLLACPASVPAAQQVDSSTDRIAERLRKLEALFKQGLIEQADYKAKKTEILSEL